MKSAAKVTTTADGKELASDQLEVKVLLRGTPEAVIGALTHGFPREALEAMRDAFDEELRRRKEPGDVVKKTPPIRSPGAPPQPGKCPVRPALDGAQGNPMRTCTFPRGHRGPHSWTRRPDQEPRG